MTGGGCSDMLRTYGPHCDGSLLDADPHGAISPTATWIDLEEPTPAEEKLVEQALGIAVPTRADLAEIEPSSRLYEQDGNIYLTMSTLRGVEEGEPTTEPIGFVLADNSLVTIRYAAPKPVRAFISHVLRDPLLAQDALTVLVRLLDAIVDRLADELEVLGANIEDLSKRVFSREVSERRIPAKQLEALINRLGRAQSLLARIRESTVSALRLLSFLAGSTRLQDPKSAGAHAHVVSVQTDASALIDHSAFLSGNLQFLLDAALGLISIEQNAAMKLFSWAALVFLPPTLIAGIFGMNFHHMPELDWLWGYPISLGLMVASAVLPLWFLKKRGWI
jgi:magnesium transporter